MPLITGGWFSGLTVSLNCVLAVRIGCVTVNHTLDVIERNKILGQFLCERCLNFTFVFSKLRWNILQV